MKSVKKQYGNPDLHAFFTCLFNNLFLRIYIYHIKMFYIPFFFYEKAKRFVYKYFLHARMRLFSHVESILR